MKLSLCILTLLCLLFRGDDCLSQESGLNPVLTRDNNYGSISHWGTVTDIKQDPWGYIWFSTAFKGLQRYDGVNLVSYQHEEQNINSLSANRIPNFIIDSSGVIWTATYGAGLDQFDPVENRFIHFRHDAGDAGSLSNDTVFCVLRDHTGVLWVGTYGGLDMMNERTGKFKHFKNISGDSSSISFNRIWYLYEDKQGTLWVGCGSPFTTFGERPEDGGLNRFDRTTGKFIRYLHDPNDSTSIANNKVKAIYEDSKNNFWIGGAENTLEKMDRKSGKFAHYNYDPKHPEKLSGPPVKFHEDFAIAHITFINEDSKGVLWIGSTVNGTNTYDPVTKKLTHISPNLFRSFNSTNGLTWFSSATGEVYNIDLTKTTIPYHHLYSPINALYYEEDNHALWIGGKGLFMQEINNLYDTLNKRLPLKSFIADTVNAMESDGNGNLWIASSGGLLKFDLQKRTFIAYKHLDNDTTSISSNRVASLFIDHNKNIWTSSGNWIVEKLDPSSGVFTHYRYNANPNSLINDYASCFMEDHAGDIWFGARGLFRIDHKIGKLRWYLESSIISGICVDANGVVWTGSNEGLYLYDSTRNRFMPFNHPLTGSIIKGIKNILEDNNKNLWVSTTTAVIKINDARNEIKIYGGQYGVHENNLLYANNFKTKNGKLYLLDQGGYYFLDPSLLKTNEEGPTLHFTGIEIGNRQDQSQATGPLIQPMPGSKEIDLKYNQNTFSIDFFAFDYKHPGEIDYVFMLEDYDNNWRYNGNRTSVDLLRIPPGQYHFRVKAVNGNGIWSEKAILIVISPPWWRTWWAYCIYGILFLFITFFANRMIRNRIIEKEQMKSKEKELIQAREIEKAYNELKATQQQLIQSEKMASLGELTAGIAHEIQNPLNFVNNFSEVNDELIDELVDEVDKGNIADAKTIAADIKQNLEKINQHGKRADAIVKGMLQHSRATTGKKEPTDINALADEYLRLSYHGMRAKDKSFNVTIETDFDNSIGKINIVPQDIGRVLLNLINNAFYAVTEKRKTAGESYEPTVTISTTSISSPLGGRGVEIKVIDNGGGIPQKILEKIFQPFFTTKPTGQGTGLGLSLAYDIIKAHGGEIKVETKEGEGSEFIIELPLNKT